MSAIEDVNLGKRIFCDEGKVAFRIEALIEVNSMLNDSIRNHNLLAYACRKGV